MKVKKSGNEYGEKTAYQIKLEKNKYQTFSHKEVREMIDALRNIFNKYRLKR